MYRRLTKQVLPLFRVAPLFFLILFFVINRQGFSQTFEKWYVTKNDDIAYDAVELDQSYIITINSGSYFDENYDSKLIKLNLNGELIDSLNMVIPEGYKLYSTFRLFLLNDTILLTISPLKNNMGEIGIKFTHISKNFDILYDTIVCDTVTTRQYYDFIIDNDSNVVAVGTNTWFEEFFISVYDVFGNTIGYNTYTDTQTGYLPSTIIDIPGRNVYHMYIYWSDDEYFFEINKETLQVDTVLHYPDGFLPRNTIKGLDNNSYYLAGKQFSQTLSSSHKLLVNEKKIIESVIINQDLSFIEMDNYGNVLNQKVYIVSSDTNSFYSYNSFDIYNDKIYFGGTYNFDNATAFPFSAEYRWIFINKLNPDGSIIWQRFYKGDANYVPYKVLATTDGGALILSTKYDWNDPVPYQRDLHILKVDSTGWYDGMTTGETQYDQPKQILVYPNPVKDKVTFVTGLYNNLELSIYNLQGKPVLKQKLPYTQTIDISALPKGLYVYIITGKNGFIEKGKLLKER